MHCLSRRRVHASRPPRRAAQRTRRSRATKRARLLFGDFFLAKQEKVTRRSTAKTSGGYEEKTFLIGNQRVVFAAWQQVGFSESPSSTPDARGLFSETQGSAADRRAYFLLLRQNKVAKEKATPAYAVGCADCLALLEVPGGCGTRGCAPQTVLADCPRPFCAARRFRWGPQKASQLWGPASNPARLQLERLNCSESDAFYLPSASSFPRRRESIGEFRSRTWLINGPKHLPNPPLARGGSRLRFRHRAPPLTRGGREGFRGARASANVNSNAVAAQNQTLCPRPLRRRAAQAGRGFRLALFEPQASSCKPPAPSSSAEYPA